MHTSKRDYDLLDELAEYFDILASDSEGMAARGMDKRRNSERAKVWREAANDVRSIHLDAVGPRPKAEATT
jgi:hypothetical protein